MQRISIRTVLAVGVVLAAAPGALVASAAPPPLIERIVDIWVEHDRAVGSAGPLVLWSGDALPGPGPELTLESHPVDNPSGWDGNVLVDIDPETQTITVEVENQGCYDDVLVKVRNIWMTSVATVSDDLFDPTGSPVSLTASMADPGDDPGVVLHWVSENGDCPGLNVEGSQAVFSYEATFYAPMTVGPPVVTEGDPVTVTGWRCPNGIVELRVLLTMTEAWPHGGSNIPVIEAEANGGANGIWQYVIDTTGLEPAIYGVRGRCVLVEGQSFDYEGDGFMVTAGPAEPVPADANFAG